MRMRGSKLLDKANHSLEKGQFVRARSYFKKALPSLKKSHDGYEQAQVLYQLSNVNRQLERFKEAEKNYETVQRTSL